MLFHEIRISGLLSFGPGGVSLPMKPLNVLIGPNGSGKSNFLEAIALFRGAPCKVTDAITRKGGLADWKWKGTQPCKGPVLEALMDVPTVDAVRHRIEFGERNGAVSVLDEAIEPTPGRGRRRYSRPPRDPGTSHRMAEADARRRAQAEQGSATSHIGSIVVEESADAVEYAEHFRPEESLLGYAATPERPVLWCLKEQYEGIRMFRDWSFGPGAEVRDRSSAHHRSDFLGEGARNLAVVLSHFRGEQKHRFLEATRRLFDGIMDVSWSVDGGVVSLHLEEDGGRSIPASRMSDGTLRYLSLLAILLHPRRPAVICIEEPELGLHPDLMPTIADLLIEASERTQLVVTTHSDILVDALTEQPECIVVCEKHDGQTMMRRLDRERLGKWLADYRLGNLWISGELGGNRW